MSDPARTDTTLMQWLTGFRGSHVARAVRVVGLLAIGVLLVYVRSSPVTDGTVSVSVGSASDLPDATSADAVRAQSSSSAANAAIFIDEAPPRTAPTPGNSLSDAISNRLPTGGLRLWRAAFDYCKDPPPCVLDPARQTDALSSVYSIVHADEQDVGWVVTAGEPFVVLIRARDANGHDRRCGGDSFQVDIRGPSVFQGYPVDLLDGTYALSVVLFDPGNYDVRGRLDFRACQGLSRCQSQNVTELVFEYVGRVGRRMLKVQQSAGTDGKAIPSPYARGIWYRAGVAFNDASYFKGRWQNESLVCRGGKAVGSGCYAGVPRTSDLVWHPVDDRRPVLPLTSLRGKWVHSIGDSLSRNLNIDMALLLQSMGVRFERFCVYRNLAAVPVVFPNGTKTLVWRDRAKMAPLLVLSRDCQASETATVWVDDATGRVYQARYAVWWMVHEYPDLNFTMTQQWMTFGSRDHPPYFSWALDPFLRFVDGHKAFWGPLPTSTLNAARPSATAVADVASRTLTEGDTDAPSQPEHVEVVDSSSAAMHRLFAPGREPILLVNKGLHHVSDATDPHLDAHYESYVLAFLQSLREDFPLSTILWRSTATTQWTERLLPEAHRCRTSYRVAFANERAASAIVAFNGEEEARGHNKPVRVLDYYQMSLGRPDAAPDNRHFKLDVEGAVVDELLNILTAEDA